MWVVDDLLSQLSVGDVLEVFIVLGGASSAAALLVAKEVVEQFFAGHLVCAGEKGFEDELALLGDLCSSTSPLRTRRQAT